MSFPLLYFRDIKGKGRGVFSAYEIDEEVLIERCPIILITSAAEINLIVCTSLLNYAFRWDKEENTVAIALGFGSLYNHSCNNNAYYKMNSQKKNIEIITLRKIHAGKEVTINYVAFGSNNAEKWFKDRGIQYVKQ